MDFLPDGILILNAEDILYYNKHLLNLLNIDQDAQNAQIQVPELSS
jgi:hypothetical protein